MKVITTEKSILSETSEILTTYFRSIAHYPIYSALEQIQLAKEAKEGNIKSRDKLIFSNLRFAVTCAKKYIGQGVPLIDLIEAANLGLILSIKNYNPDKGIHFISFAVWYIRREILKAIYNNGKTIRYPITHISKMNKVKKITDSIFANEFRDPTKEEVLEKTDLTEKQYYSVIDNQINCQSIDSPITTDGKVTVENYIADESNPISDTFTREAVSNALKILNEKEYKVITEYYGLDGCNVKPVGEIARELNLGNERVRQIRKNGIKKLRKKCGGVLKSLL